MSREISVLAIDLGSRFVGWARFELDHALLVARPVAAGVWEIGNRKATKGSKKKPGREADAAGAKWVRLAYYLAILSRESGATKIYFENVIGRHASRLAAAGYFGALAVLELHCANGRTSPVPVSVQEVKRFALGRGAGEKAEVVAAIERAFPSLGKLEEDAADAVSVGGAGLVADGWRVQA